jgi:hypothetical protein
MLARALQILLLLAAVHVHAQVIDIKQFAIASTEEGYTVDADFEFGLTPRLEEALRNGVPLYFAVEFELIRPRWYWFDEAAVNTRIDVRLSYNSLLRQYRLSTGPLQRNFSSYEDAMNVLSRVRSWLVIERDKLPPDTRYQAGLRMRLDTTQLPRPFQLSAITDRELNLSSAWKRIAFTSDAEKTQK